MEQSTVHAIDGIRDFNSIAIDCQYPVTDDANMPLFTLTMGFI